MKKFLLAIIAAAFVAPVFAQGNAPTTPATGGDTSATMPAKDKKAEKKEKKAEKKAKKEAKKKEKKEKKEMKKEEKKMDKTETAPMAPAQPK